MSTMSTVNGSGDADTQVSVRWKESMRDALTLAKIAGKCGDVPVGAVVLDSAGQVVGRGRNMREEHRDPLSHAEIEALQDAARRRGEWRLDDCTLVVTLEPCPMCAGALVGAHIARVVFGAWDAKMGACGSVWDIPRDPHVGARPEVYGGVLQDACEALLSDYFRSLRA